jgi:hypothetical protein
MARAEAKSLSNMASTQPLKKLPSQSSRQADLGIKEASGRFWQKVASDRGC